jgi:hypothetical protein
MAVAYGLAYLVTAILMGVALSRRRGHRAVRAPWTAALGSALLSVGVMAVVQSAVAGSSRLAAAVTVLAAGAAGALTYAGSLWVFTGSAPGRLLALDDA